MRNKIFLFCFLIFLLSRCLYAFDFMNDMIVNNGQTLYDASITDTEGQYKFGVFPNGAGIKTPGTAFTIKGSLTPGGLPRTYSYLPAEDVASVFKREKETAGTKGQGMPGQESFYPFVSGELDTTGSCWYDDKVYLLAVKSDKRAVITILPYSFRFYEGTLSPRNGFEKKLRETKTDIICWGQSSQIANMRCYFFLEPQGSKEPYQIYIQKSVGDKVSEPVLFTFRRDMGSGSLSSKENMGGLGRGSPFPSNRARLSNGQR